ncbi:MAG TPA: hypothetical protein VFQ43_04615, partial [Nitrososphaera sp.]|nr:hypothetical protein [Nitrososphaera sp.]
EIMTPSRACFAYQGLASNKEALCWQQGLFILELCYWPGKFVCGSDWSSIRAITLVLLRPKY